MIKKTAQKKKVSSTEDFLTADDIHKALDEMEEMDEETEDEDEQDEESEESEEEEETVVKGKKSGKIKGTNADVDESDEDDEESEDDEDEQEDEEEEEEEEEEVKPKKKVIKKGGTSTKPSTKKSSVKKKPIKKAVDNDEEEEEEEEEIEKALEVSPVLRKFDNRLKGMNSDQREYNRKMTKVLKGIAQTVLNMQEQMDEFNNEAPQPKSITKRPIERFEKGSESKRIEADGKNVLSVRVHKAQVLDLLDEMTFGGGKCDDIIAKAMTEFEAGGDIPAPIVHRMQKEYGVQLIK